MQDENYSINGFINFLEKLDELGMVYQINKNGYGSVTVTLHLPGAYWEVQFETYGDLSKCVVLVEQFKSDGILHGKEALDELLGEYEKMKDKSAHDVIAEELEEKRE